jgi:hypothetical protein
MKITNPRELVRKEVVDVEGNSVGWIDKTWSSWNQEYPGWFFGIKPNENTRGTYFRGTYKLFPVYSDYIREVGKHVTLNKTMDELCRYWIKTVPCGSTTCPTDELIEKPVFDKNHSRVGTFFSWMESGGTYQSYGCLVDPYLCEYWKIPYNMLMPVPTNYITYVKDTVSLDKTLDELREYWKQHHKF